MSEKNIGRIDRVLRIILGVALIAGFFLGLGGSYHWIFLVGIFPIVTALVERCPGYRIFGISTCPTDL